jgi:LysM repeat protein
MSIHRLVAVLVLSAVVYSTNGGAQAAQNEPAKSETVEVVAAMLDLKEPESLKLETKLDEFPDRTAEVKAVEAAKPAPRVEHIVAPGDSLDAIAQANQVTWPRVFDANTHIADPNVIAVGEKVSIPRADEQIPSRTAPAPVSAPAPEPARPQITVATKTVSVSSTAGLLGSIGYARWGGNCVNEPGVNNPHDGTNPISWPATSGTPWIGATVLFYYNHTGVVTGIWPNGDIEIRHQNFQGDQHRFPRSAFRGFR